MSSRGSLQRRLQEIRGSRDTEAERNANSRVRPEGGGRDERNPALLLWDRVKHYD